MDEHYRSTYDKNKSNITTIFKLNDTITELLHIRLRTARLSLFHEFYSNRFRFIALTALIYKADKHVFKSLRSHILLNTP